MYAVQATVMSRLVLVRVLTERLSLCDDGPNSEKNHACFSLSLYLVLLGCVKVISPPRLNRCACVMLVEICVRVFECAHHNYYQVIVK